uniref:hypothetical protein n=1 Tax=Rhodococcus hoagii TaxID=43767 RepID=UPI00155DAB80|nr:hypothetical protein [Prescottella equi]
MRRLTAAGFLSTAAAVVLAAPAYAAALPAPTIAAEVTGDAVTVTFTAPEESSWCGNGVMSRDVADALVEQLGTLSPGGGFAFPEDRVWPVAVGDDGAMIDGGETSTVTIAGMKDGKYTAITVCTAFIDGQHQTSYLAAPFQIGGSTGSLGSLNQFDFLGS